jgi:glycosyltransferase involved in cell wall biosynthesis
LNIGIIHGFVGGGGGTEKTLRTIFDILENSKHTITLYTFSKPTIKSNKIKIKSVLPISIPSFGLYQRAMESNLISKAKNEDILIQASGGLGIPVNPNQKIIVYCHSDFTNELENPATKYKGIWLLYYKSYYNMIKKFVENIGDSRIHLISNSKYVHDSIKSKFGKDSEIVYPPVDLKEFSPGNKEDMVVTIGRFSEEKNLEFGINVMKEIDCKYDIIGNTKTKSNILYYDKLDSKIKKENTKSINLLKNISRNELVNTVNKAKVYFHCSRETFGISVIESIAAGCIPIVPDNSAHKETVPFEELRYSENDSTDAKNKLERAINGEFDSMIKPLQDSIKKFSKEKFQQSFLFLTEELTKV